MIQKFFVLCLVSTVLTACQSEDKHKEYSIEEITAAWVKDGEHAALVEEVWAECRKAADIGKNSPACTVYNVAQSRIDSIELIKKINKNKTN